MTNQHPITPPPELFQMWEDDILNERDNVDHVLVCAWKDGFLAGADQELEACVKWMNDNVPYGYGHRGEVLRISRRPKPSSLKEQALDELDLIPTHDNEGRTVGVDVSIIRRALEQLND